MLREAELNLSAARAQLQRAADGNVDGPPETVASYAADAAHAAQEIGGLIRLLHERLVQVEQTTGCTPQPESASPRPRHQAPRMVS